MFDVLLVQASELVVPDDAGVIARKAMKQSAFRVKVTRRRDYIELCAQENSEKPRWIFQILRIICARDTPVPTPPG